MKRGPLRTALLALALFAIPAQAAVEATVLFPPDLTLSPEAKIRIYAYRPSKAVPVKVSVNGSPAADLEGETSLKGEVSLFPGINLVQVGEKMIRVFVLPDTKMEVFSLPTGAGNATLDFRRLRPHPALDDGCEGCHTPDGAKLAVKDQKEACYACHNDFTKSEGDRKLFVHSPVASGECASCHDPHYSARPKLQKLEKGCLECHDPFPQEGSVHRPVANGECVSCHNPHASPAAKQLVRAGNSLCLGCHKTPHALHRTAEVKGWMTKVPPEFPQEKDELSCRGCHVPHQSPERRLFVKPQGEFCKTCHGV